MSSRPLSATLPPPGLPVRSGELFAQELAALVDDIQRTRDWINRQLDAQLACLHKLCATTPAYGPKPSPSLAPLFEAPHPVPPVPAKPPAPPKAISSVHQAIVLPPTLTATLDPQLEQATLHELNNALTRAFSEISARGGMIS